MRLLPLQPLAAGPTKWPSFWFVLGVLLPVFVIIEELVYGGCVSIMDPMPTWAHVPLLSLVPASNYAAYRMLVRGEKEPSTRMLWLLGAGMGVMTFYAVLCCWVSVFSAMLAPFALIMSMKEGFEIGLCVLLGLSPLLMFSATLRWQWPIVKSRPYGRAAFVVISLLLLADLPQHMQARWSSTAVRAIDLKERGAALENLRTWGSDRSLLRQCYSSKPFATPLDFALQGGPLGPFINFHKWGPAPVTADEARELFYRVTGRPFNELPPEPKYARGDLFEGRQDTFDGFVWDGDRGGDRVGARLSGLSVTASDLLWQLEPAASTAYGEWTMVFKNNHSNQQEARCQIQLPPNSVVSRLTLWINDQPQEAAFASKTQVTAAYQQVVKVERRDPVLVNHIAPDRISLQCFPVPPKGGIMKVRIGITSSLHGKPKAKLWQPHFLERNFSIGKGTKHQIKLQSPGESTQTLATTDLRQSSFEVATQDQPIWTEDSRHTGEDRFILRRPIPAQMPKFESYHLIVDATASLATRRDEIIQSLKTFSHKAVTTVYWPTDLGHASGTVDQAMGQMRFIGGMDSTAALTAALESAAKAKNAAVIWVCGTQPILLGESAPPITILDALTVRIIDCSAGPNRLLERLPLSHTASLQQLRDEPLTAEMLGDFSRGSHEYQRLTTAPTDAVHVSDHLVRLWAKHHVSLNDATPPQDRSALAAKYQLVTPFSGAVVLETKEQYDRAGLAPVDPSSVPHIPTTPEPSGALMLMVLATGRLLRRRR